jgi:hypothetical protein
MFDRAALSAKVLPSLRAALGDSGRTSGAHADLAEVYRVLEVLADDGVDLVSMRGPWQAGSAPPNRGGRAGRRQRPYVELGRIQLFVESPSRAGQLAGFLNWCEVEEGDLTSGRHGRRS